MGKEEDRRLHCGHCRIDVDMHHLTTGVYCEEGVDDKYWWRYYLYQCPACKDVTLLLEYSTTEEYFGYDELPVHTSFLYPPKPDVDYLPDSVRKEVTSALSVRRTDGNAFAVLVGRALESVCADFSAEGKTLYHQLEDLAGRGLIPGNLMDATKQIRLVRNMGAHASIGTVSERDVNILDTLLRTVLEYLYKAPALIAELNKSVKGSS